MALRVWSMVNDRRILGLGFTAFVVALNDRFNSVLSILIKVACVVRKIYPRNPWRTAAYHWNFYFWFF